ncbi:MAG: cell division protein FtsI/penicillin-binding protein 2 [Planctomycetota bacterium]
MSAHFDKGTFDSASGLRPMSAYVMIAFVLVVSAVQLGKKALGGIPEKTEGKYGRVVQTTADLPPYRVEDRNGVILAASVPSFDLVVSPRGLWQGHTPERIMPGLVDAIAGASGREVDLEQLYASMLPTDDVDAIGGIDGWRVVNTWALQEDEAARLSAWIADEQLLGWSVEPFRQLMIKRALKTDSAAPEGIGTWRLMWQPRVALSLEERARYQERKQLEKDIGAAAWGRRLVKGIFLARRGPDVEGEDSKPKYSSSEDGRDTWAALMVPVNAVPLERLTPDENEAVQRMLEKEKVAGHLVRLRSRYDRYHPAGEFSVLGDWGFTKEGQEKEAPYVGLELIAERHLNSGAHNWFEEAAATYEFRADWVARKGGRPYFGKRSGGSEPVVVETTIDSHLQRFLGKKLGEIMETERAAVAMGIVVDVASGEILAVDSLEAYPTRSFSPLNHLFTPGSTMKAVVMAMGLDSGVVNTDFTGYNEADKDTTWFDVGLGHSYSGGRNAGYTLPREIARRNIGEALGAPRGRQPLTALLAFSSNGGMVQMGIQMDPTYFRGKLVDLGYGQKPGSGMGSESFLPIMSLKNWTLGYTQASISFGNEIAVNLWQHAEAMTTVLRDGVRRPLTVLRSVSQGETSEAILDNVDEYPRVFAPGVGREVREMMGVGSLVGTGKDIRREDLDMGTKTGTTMKNKAIVCSHLIMPLAAEYTDSGFVPTIAQMKADRARLLLAAKPHKRSECYTSSIAAVGHLPDSPSGVEREIFVLVVVDEPQGEKFGSRVAGPAAVAVLAEALGVTRDGKELIEIPGEEDSIIAVEAGSEIHTTLAPEGSATSGAQPWLEANL